MPAGNLGLPDTSARNPALTANRRAASPPLPYARYSRRREVLTPVLDPANCAPPPFRYRSRRGAGQPPVTGRSATTDGAIVPELSVSAGSRGAIPSFIPTTARHRTALDRTSRTIVPAQRHCPAPTDNRRMPVPDHPDLRGHQSDPADGDRQTPDGMMFLVRLVLNPGEPPRRVLNDRDPLVGTRPLGPAIWDRCECTVAPIGDRAQHARSSRLWLEFDIQGAP